ncbi:MFS transporter [Amycolatopsis granulosa]|uniref:MFS transporter n=1 Tax=Amycolatopsis granulosa TaxID=185684 RepID=UPI00141FEE07|nr:MFS transporter [Amycolatopsis granulosa]NIH87702.1 DHA1 family inner membrane transport protein [Amycolatopsis granulosa]
MTRTPAPDSGGATPGEGSAASHWRSVLMLGFGTFAIGTDEFVLAGVLPEFSRSLDVSIATAGQVVTVFALTCAVMSPILATLTAAWPRHRVLKLSVLLYLLGVVGTGLAPNFPGVLIAQVVAAAGAGLYIPAASVTASALVGPERRGRAIAAVTTGLTAATALGAPIGTVVGSALGWRATMWFITLLTVLSLAGVLALVPRVSVAAPGGLRQRLAPLGDRRVVVVLATTLVAFTAAYVVYTYMAEVFAPATGGDGTRLAVLMFAFGLTGTAGNFYAGTLADRFGARLVVGGAVTLLAASLVVLPFATGSFPAALVITVVYGIAAWGITTPQQSRLIALNPASAPLLISLNAAFLYLAIAFSGVIGAVGIGAIGARWISLIGAAVAVLALALSELGHRLARSRSAPVAETAA